jgi:chemotaxis protein histidine kinase CheA
MTMDVSREEAPLGNGSDSRTGPMEEASLEEARRLLAFLAESTGSLRNARDASAVLDEAYRAAHSLKGELDQAAMPGVVRIARLIQDIVRAVRAGRIPAGAEVGSMLSFAARGALDSLEAHVAGAPDSGACESASRALETLLAQPASPYPAEASGAKTGLVLTRVDARRLRAAQEASIESGAAAASVARAAEESLALLTALRALAAQQERGARELLDAIPGGLAAAARGQPTTSIAGELSGRVAALGRMTSEFEESFSGFAARLREAAKKGERAFAAAREATARIGRVRLAALFAGFPRLVRRHALKLSITVEIVVDVHECEIDATLADIVATTMNRCARASLVAELKRSKSRGKKTPTHGSRFQLQAAAEGDEVRVSLQLHGRAASKEKLEEALSDLRPRLERKGIRFQIDSENAESALFTLKVPRPRGQGNLDGSFILGRAGDSLYAIAVDEVVKCIVAPPPGQEYASGSEKLQVMSMAGTVVPRAGVVVSAGGRKAVLLFDKLEGEERLTPAPIEYAGARTPGMAAAATRADGDVALIIDVASYISAPRADRKRKP